MLPRSSSLPFRLQSRAFHVARQFTSLSEPMSPTVFRDRGYRFFFFSREESRMHVHIAAKDGEASTGSSRPSHLLAIID